MNLLAGREQALVQIVAMHNDDVVQLDAPTKVGNPFG